MTKRDLEKYYDRTINCVRKNHNKKYNKYIITLVRKIDYVSVNTILLHAYDNEKMFNIARKKLFSTYVDLNIFVSFIAYDKGNNFHLDITIK